MRRRCFDHFHAALCVAADTRIGRYPLWLAFHELGLDPEAATPTDLLDFLDFRAPSWLREEMGLRLGTRQLARLRRALEGYDPSVPTPEERLTALAG